MNTYESRFWSKVDIKGQDDCWEWHGANANGYGRLRVGSLRDGTRRLIIAHRFAYESEYGPIPDGMLVCHHCDNPPCCNPRHLFVGTIADNNRDKSEKGRYVSPACKGMHNGRSKLTDDDVREIRRAYASKEMGGYRLAAKYGVSDAVIYSILRNKRWTHVK